MGDEDKGATGGMKKEGQTGNVDGNMDGDKDGKGLSVKDLIRQLQTLSPEDRDLVTTALQPTVRQKSSGDRNIGGNRDGNHGNSHNNGDPHIEHLIHTPRINNFSGDGKGEATYEQWKFEVLSLQREGMTEHTVQQCIRRSLRGTAAEVMHNLGEASVDDILEKLDQIFGNVLPSENILESFYSARQQKDESIASWACRLEGIIAKLRNKENLTKEDEESRLRSKFFSGLHKQNLKTAIRHYYDEGKTYKDLLVAARIAELENPDTVRVQQTSVSTADAKKLDDVLAALGRLTERLDKLEKQQTHEQPQNQTVNQQIPDGASTQGTAHRNRAFKGTCYGCGAYGHRRWECPLNSYQPGSGDRR